MDKNLASASTNNHSSQSNIIEELDLSVEAFWHGAFDPKYQIDLIQTVLDMDLHLTRYPSLIRICDYYVQEGLCYYVPS